ncbi:MAG: phage holin family protein [Verrucomicrobiota bacterium]
MDFARLLKSWVLIALGVLLASGTAGGIRYDSTGSLVVAVIVLSLCNVFLKPLLMLFSLPFIVLTFGLGIWLINAVLFLLVGEVVGGFHVDSFWNALWGAFVVSLTGALANLFFAPKGTRRVNIQVRRGPGGPGASTRGGSRRPLKDDDDVIDV